MSEKKTIDLGEPLTEMEAYLAGVPWCAYAEAEKNGEDIIYPLADECVKEYGSGKEGMLRFAENCETLNPCPTKAEMRAAWDAAVAKLARPDTSGWDNPISLKQQTVASFPLEALPEPFMSYAKAVSLSTQTPVDMAGALALSVISVCVQGKWRIRGKADWTEPLNTYVLSIAAPSERKSAVMRAMTQPLNEYETAWNRLHAGEIEESRMRKRILEHKQKVMEEDAARKGNDGGISELAREIAAFREINPIRLYVDDVTPEKLTSTLADSGGRTAVISSEGGLFQTLAGQYSKSVNIDVMLKGYSGDPIRVDRIGRTSETIQDPALTVLMMLQPDLVSDIINNRNFRGRGLMARFLYSMPDSNVGKRSFTSSPVPQKLEITYKKRVCDLLRDEEKGLLVLDREATGALAAFSEELEAQLPRELHDISDWAGKLAGAVLRMSGLIHLAKENSLKGTACVTGEEMNAAVSLGRYFLSHAKRVFGIAPGMGLVNEASELVRLIASLEKESFTLRDLMRTSRKYKSAQLLISQLSTLEELGYVKRAVPKGKGTKPGRCYLVHPNIMQYAD